MLNIYVPGCKAAYILTKPCGNRSQGPHEPITLSPATLLAGFKIKKLKPTWK